MLSLVFHHNGCNEIKAANGNAAEKNNVGYHAKKYEHPLESQNVKMDLQMGTGQLCCLRDCVISRRVILVLKLVLCLILRYRAYASCHAQAVEFVNS